MTPWKPSKRCRWVKRTNCRSRHSYCTLLGNICSEFERYSGLLLQYTTQAPQVDPGCTWHVVAQSKLHCIWFALAALLKLYPAHTDKLRGQRGVAGFLPSTQRAPASQSSIPPSVPPSHLLQLSNHPMTFKGAWHPFEVGEGALALVSCPNPTQANKMHAGLKRTKGIPVH